MISFDSLKANFCYYLGFSVFFFICINSKKKHVKITSANAERTFSITDASSLNSNPLNNPEHALFATANTFF